MRRRCSHPQILLDASIVRLRSASRHHRRRSRQGRARSHRLARRFEAQVINDHIKGDNMKVVVRKYSGTGARELLDALEKQKAGVEDLLRSVKGFVSYTLARSGNGGFSV